MSPLHKDSKLKDPFESSGPTAKAKKAKKKSPRAKDPTAGLEVANPNAGAIDVGCHEHWAAVPPGRGEPRKFGCCTADLKQLAEWLKQCSVETVVMEATGDYWVVLYDLLEERGLKPVVVNPRYAKNMSGKKGDIPDCQWMQKLHTYGLFVNSFRPTESIRVLRTYMRQRERVVALAAQSIQHMQKALTEMNLQLANVISDISGETGLRIIDQILSGERDPQKLAELKDPRIKASRREIARALEGYWKEELLFVLEQARGSYSHYQKQLEQCEGRIQEQVRSLESKIGGPDKPANQPGSQKDPEANSSGFKLEEELRRIAGVDLTAIPSIGAVTAQVVLSEVGVDMSAWRSEKHFASWLGLSPDHKISGGRILGRSTRPVVSRARNALRMAAYTLDHSYSALGAKYRRLKRRLGAPKAIVAMAHHLACLIYRMIKHGQEYVEKGMEAYEAKYRKQRTIWLQKQAKELNLQLVPIE